MGREGRCPSRESHEYMFYIYVLGSTAAQLIRRNRNLKLCQTKPELFVSLSLLLLASAGSVCIECGTCTGWDVEGLCLEGSLGWDMSLPAKPVCAELLCAAWYRGSQGLTHSALAVLLICTSTMLGWLSNSPSPAFLSCQRKIMHVEALIPLAAK